MFSGHESEAPVNTRILRIDFGHPVPAIFGIQIITLCSSRQPLLPVVVGVLCRRQFGLPRNCFRIFRRSLFFPQFLHADLVGTVNAIIVRIELACSSEQLEAVFNKSLLNPEVGVPDCLLHGFISRNCLYSCRDNLFGFLRCHHRNFCFHSNRHRGEYAAFNNREGQCSRSSSF